MSQSRSVSSSVCLFTECFTHWFSVMTVLAGWLLYQKKDIAKWLFHTGNNIEHDQEENVKVLTGY